MRLDLVAVMRPMHEETAGTHRLQALERFGDPVDVRDHLALDCRVRIFLGEKLSHARQDLVFLLAHQIDGGLPDISLFVDLGGRDRIILFAESKAHQIKDPVGVFFGGGHIKADFGHDRSSLEIRAVSRCGTTQSPQGNLRRIARHHPFMRFSSFLTAVSGFSP